jgi:hypothetical protein
MFPVTAAKTTRTAMTARNLMAALVLALVSAATWVAAIPRSRYGPALIRITRLPDVLARQPRAPV